MKIKTIIIVALTYIAIIPIDGQSSREYIKNSINSWGSCRNVAITDNGGDVAINYKNDYSYKNIPTSLADAIKDLRNKDMYIDDIQLTEAGSWIILYGDNGFRWSNIPYSLEQAMKRFNEEHEVITSVTFNDVGDWIIISTNSILASSDNVNDWIEEGLEDYGSLWSAHLTNDGVVLCFKDGYKYFGNVPIKLKQSLKESSIDAYRIKFTSEGSYFYADKSGKYRYYM